MLCYAREQTLLRLAHKHTPVRVPLFVFNIRVHTLASIRIESAGNSNNKTNEPKTAKKIRLDQIGAGTCGPGSGIERSILVELNRIDTDLVVLSFN